MSPTTRSLIVAAITITNLVVALDKVEKGRGRVLTHLLTSAAGLWVLATLPQE